MPIPHDIILIVGFFSGDGALPAMPKHFHFQFSRGAPGPEPLRSKAHGRAIAEHDLQGGEEETRNCSVPIRDSREYPIAAICFPG